MIRERRGAWSGVVRTGLPTEGGGARGGEGSGREVEARNDHGCSLWPTAKRFCSPLRKTHRLNSCVYLNDGKTPAITGENGLTRAGCVCPDPNGRRIRCALHHQRRTISAFPITHAIASPGPLEAGFLFPCATDRRVTQGGNRHYLPVGLPSYSPVTFTSAPNLLASASCSAAAASGSTNFRHLA